MCDTIINLPLNGANIETIEGNLNNQFEVLGKIGNGSFGKVVKVRHKQTDTIYAIKMFYQEISDKNNDAFDKECQCLSQIRSDFVVEFRSAWIEGQRLHIETEYCDHNLREVINAKIRLFSQPSVDDTSVVYVLALIDYFIAYEMFEELTKSLNYLHTLDTPIIHRDLKPENILVVSSLCGAGGSLRRQFIKICDFGYAKPHDYSGQSHTKDKGDITYMAPEVVRSKHYDLKSDIYSLGLICGELFAVNAYSFDKSMKTKHSELKEKYRCLHEPMMEMLTEPLYDQRPTCADVMTRMVGWRLSANELLIIQDMFGTIKSFNSFDLKFFPIYLLTKLNARLNESGVDPSGDCMDTPVVAPHPTLAAKQSCDTSFTDYRGLEASEGDIIEIVGTRMDCSTVWGVYVGDHYIVYVCPDTNRVLRQKLDTVCLNNNKSCRVNNLMRFSQTRQLSVRSVDTILADALRALNRYGEGLPTDSRGHNFRIHFVTKCRFGRQYCEACGPAVVPIL